jgi:hypothetical protein
MPTDHQRPQPAPRPQSNQGAFQALFCVHQMAQDERL